MYTDFPIQTLEQTKFNSTDRVLNTILHYSKTNDLVYAEKIMEALKKALIPHYGISNITHDQLLRIIFKNYNTILSDKRFEVYKSIDSIVLDLLKYDFNNDAGVGIQSSSGTLHGTFITHEILIKRILIEITLSRVDWLDYLQT